MTTVQPHWVFINGLSGVILMYLLYSVEFRHLTTSEDLWKYFEIQTEYHHTTDNDTLVDMQDFQYIMNNASICSSSATVGDHSSIVIIVHTARSHFLNRYAIRETWGSVKFYKGWALHLVFLLGSDHTGRDGLETRLLEENIQHGDLVMGNFLDSYKNVTYKHMMGYKWVTSFCSGAKLILKTVDDVFVDIYNLVESIVAELILSDKAYACQITKDSKPARNPNATWYVREQLYANDTYPDFCNGTVYLVKTPPAADIYSFCSKVHSFFMDEVYVTGILRENHNIMMTNNGREERLDILPVNSRYNMSLTWIGVNRLWCSSGLNDSLPYTFVKINQDKILRDMFCTWDKVRLLKFAVNSAIGRLPNHK